MSHKKILNGGKKFYIRPIFTNYAASKDGEILNVKTGRILKKILNNNGYYHFRVNDKKLINQRITLYTGLNGNVLKVLFQKDLSLIIVILLKQIIKFTIYNY